MTVTCCGITVLLTKTVAVPAGGFGLEVYALTPTAIVAERMVYAGPSWTLGHAGPGAVTFGGTGTAWRFAEGSGGPFFETYFLLTNLTSTTATVTLTYRTAAGAVIGSDVLGVPAGVRGTVWANGTAGAQAFTTEVTSTQTIVAERAMYWPGGSSNLQSGGSPLSETAEASEASEVRTISPPTPYTLTEGVELPPVVGTAETAAVVVGKPVPGSAAGAGLGESSSSSGPSWYGSHLGRGKRS